MKCQDLALVPAQRSSVEGYRVVLRSFVPRYGEKRHRGWYCVFWCKDLRKVTYEERDVDKVNLKHRLLWLVWSTHVSTVRRVSSRSKYFCFCNVCLSIDRVKKGNWWELGLYLVHKPESRLSLPGRAQYSRTTTCTFEKGREGCKIDWRILARCYE